MTLSSQRIAVIGGGAAGMFGAIRLAELLPHADIVVFEKSKHLLSKVKISGGGRCNVTHACFDPKELVKFYPRGGKELLSPFFLFNPSNMIYWLADRGVETHTEEDGRMFPTTNNSQTIIDCFTSQAQQLGVKIRTECAGSLDLLNSFDAVLHTAGASELVWKELEAFGVPCVPRVPSLFTFNIDDTVLQALSGISVPFAQIEIVDTKIKSSGPLLITHWGISGPAVLKASSFGALALAEKKYNATVKVNWINQSFAETLEELTDLRSSSPKKKCASANPFQLPSRLWNYFLTLAHLEEKEWAHASNKNIEDLTDLLVRQRLTMNGKSTFKDEFVTAGGVDLKYVNFQTMGHQNIPRLYFAGEVLNIDAVTGGFNFQAAWTTAWIAAEGIANQLNA